MFKKILAYLGNAEAQFAIGKYYYHGGDYFQERDLEKAFYWLMKAAEQGYEESYIFIAALYERLPPPEHDHEYFEWLEKAADAGDMWAVAEQARLYRLGIRTNKDMKKAAKLYLILANKGCTYSQQMLDELNRAKIYKDKLDEEINKDNHKRIVPEVEIKTLLNLYKGEIEVHREQALKYNKDVVERIETLLKNTKKRILKDNDGQVCEIRLLTEEQMEDFNEYAGFRNNV